MSDSETLWTAARQASLSIANSRLLLLLSRFSRVWLCNPIDGSPPGSPIPGILQARTLEWVAISFSNAWKWKVKVKTLSRVRLLATPGTAAYQAPLSMGFSGQEYWSAYHCLLPPIPRVYSNSCPLRRKQWQPIPVLLPGKSHGQRSLVGCGPWGRWESDTTERLHFHFSLSCIGEGNGSPLQCSCLENPRGEGAWWAAISGVAQSQTQLKWLSSSSSMSIESVMPFNYLIRVAPFSSCPQSFLASGSFLISWLFTLGGQSIEASASVSVLPRRIQG